MPATDTRTILLKGTSIPNRIPPLSSLEIKEIGINAADGILFAKRTNNTLASFLDASKHPHVLNKSLSSIGTQHATNIVSGKLATILNGLNNSVSADGSAVLGGSNNDISHENSFALGSNIVSHSINYTYVNNLSSTGAIEPEHLILKSPNGTRWKIEVTNSGHLTATEA